jgi:glycosyltransferase involved in cell wall biosynthesis
METSKLKVAIVCDWLTGLGGAERVVVELHKLYPEAPIYTSQYEPTKIDGFTGADIRSSWLQKLPKGLKKFLPILRAWTFSRLDLSGYDLVISASGAEAKAVKTGPKTINICYCHSPTQYYWNRYDEYLKSPGFPAGFNALARLALKILVGPLRRWDRKAAQRPNYMIANSNHTQAMIKKYYGRDSVVIYPPVDIERFRPASDGGTRHGFVTAGRQTPYKRIDLAVMACSSLSLPLTVVGDGPEHAKLARLAGPTVSFETGVADSEIPLYFQQAEAFIFPTNIEDFGVTAVEALASGTPVIAYDKGGPTDYISPGQTGEFFTKQSVESLANVLSSFQEGKYDHAAIRQSAERFSADVFQASIKQFTKKLLGTKISS